jgi:hypothetical protein
MPPLRAYAWVSLTAFGAVCALVNGIGLCGAAFANDWPWVAFYTLATYGGVDIARFGRRRWMALRFVAAARLSIAEMSAAGRCQPPGHMWARQHSRAEPGWCVCGEEYRDQNECDMLNAALDRRAEP